MTKIFDDETLDNMQETGKGKLFYICTYGCP